MELHHNEAPKFACDICDKDFPFEKSLKRHKKTMHSNRMRLGAFLKAEPEENSGT